MLWESIAEENCDIAMDCASFQTSRNTASAKFVGSRRLNMNSSLLNAEMAIDELSFYDDDASSQQCSFAPHSPQLVGLLSPEGSPQRFKIVERQVPAAAVGANKFLQPSANPQQKLQNSNGKSTTSSNTTTPAKSFRMFHSISSGLGSMESSMDDEYMELFEMESLEQHSCFQSTILNVPSDLNSLISGHIKTSASPATMPKKTPDMRRASVRRCLSMTENHQQYSPKTPELLKQVQETAATTPFSSRLIPECNSGAYSNSFKRPEPPSTTCSPVLTKRYRSGAVEKENIAVATPQVDPAVASRPILRKCMSMNDAEIMTALTQSESHDQPDLIGDFSKPFALPLLEGRHRDLKSISSDTVARLIRGDFAEEVSSYKIIDCRYPYEYEGGHILGASNLFTQEQIIEEFLAMQQTEQQQDKRLEANDHKRNIVIFHCEFSSERGPKLSRFLRNNDRARNTNAYPTLDYPEVYLLHNGYKEFYETNAELCDPIAYRPMLEPAYNEAYRHFRAKTKSWNGDGLGGATSRLKKSRSRLML